MIAAVYVLLPMSEAPPAEAIRASMARFERGGRGDVPEDWLGFHDDTKHVRILHRTPLVSTREEGGGMRIEGTNDAYHLDIRAIETEMADRGVRRWPVRLCDLEPDLNDFARRFTTVGGILHTIGKRVDELTRKEDGMAITSAQMVKDLRLMNEAVSRTSDLLDGQTRQQFQEASGRFLETLANRIDLQRAQERGVEQLTRAEVESLVGANADRLIERAREVQAKEAGEAASAGRLADRAVEAERRREGRAGQDPEAERELRAERAVVAGTQQSAVREAREAAAAVEAARILAQHPAQPLSPGLIQTDALAKLRAEQERVLREIEAERAETQAIKGQRMT